MLIKQVRSDDGTGTLSYLVVDQNQHVCCAIDPNLEDSSRIQKMLEELNLSLSSIIDTHTHADHISAAGDLRAKTGAETVMHANTRFKWKIVDEGDKFGIGDTLRANANIPIDRYVDDAETITVGSLLLQVMFTPGHTDNHISLMVEDSVFTGDLLLIGQAGRSDLPGGNPEEQYDSLFKRILPLPDRTKVFPGHDYQDKEFAYLGDERKSNPFLHTRTKEQFVTFVKEFFPPFAENVAAGGKMTLQCGAQRVVQPGEKIRNITVRELYELLGAGRKPLLLDVREPVELAVAGAIEGVLNIPVKSLREKLHALPEDKSTEIVCLCQSGSRSVEAAHVLQQKGYGNIMNLSGGTSAWIKAGFPVVRSKQQVA
jgi:glyoxylase-like metal-dependent hydrolase (beta-lactamase superfamily II)/rhodanese-related sulfurtransferase